MGLGPVIRMRDVQQISAWRNLMAPIRAGPERRKVRGGVWTLRKVRGG